MSITSEKPIDLVSVRIAKALERLHELEALEEDWDSYGAMPLDKGIIRKVKQLLRELKKNPLMKLLDDFHIDVIPSASTGIGVYIDTGRKTLWISLKSISEELVVYYITVLSGKRNLTSRFNYELSELTEHLKWLAFDKR